MYTCQPFCRVEFSGRGRAYLQTTLGGCTHTHTLLGSTSFSFHWAPKDLHVRVPANQRHNPHANFQWLQLWSGTCKDSLCLLLGTQAVKSAVYSSLGFYSSLTARPNLLIRRAQTLRLAEVLKPCKHCGCEHRITIDLVS